MTDLMMRLMGGFPVYAPEGEGAGSGEAGGAGGSGGDDGVEVSGGGAGGSAASRAAAGASGEAGGKSTVADPPASPEWHGQLNPSSDDNIAKALSRFKKPEDFVKSFMSAQDKIRSGTRSAAPDGEADPEALAAWRKENGIPETVEGYKLSEDVTKAMTDDDKPMVDEFLQFAHSQNLPPEIASLTAGYYLSAQNKVLEERAAMDDQMASSAEEELRKEWGQDFNRAMGGVKALGEKFGLTVDWLEARMPDGTQLGSNVNVLKKLYEMAQSEFGDMSFAGEERAAQSSARLAELKDKRREVGVDVWNTPQYKDQRDEMLELESAAIASGQS